MKQNFAIIPCQLSWGGAFNRQAWEGAGVSSLSEGSLSDGCRVCLMVLVVWALLNIILQKWSDPSRM